MRSDLLAVAQSHGGLITRLQALELGGRHVVDDAVNDGVLLRLHPGVYVTADARIDRRLLHQAALAYLPDTALSHLDALDVWGFEVPGETAIHLTAPHSHRSVADPALALHRRRGFVAEAPDVLERDGLRVVRLERALVESWALVPEVGRRAPIITALRERRTTVSRLTAVLDDNPRLVGAGVIRQLIALVAGGCHSELELWGHDRVFSDSRLPPSVRQYAVAIRGRPVYLDRYFPAEAVDVELDGAAWHGRPEQRERDLRRDAALLAQGILVVRYSHRRMFAEPEAIIHELVDILARRRVRVAG